jgi:hypothetical protein
MNIDSWGGGSCYTDMGGETGAAATHSYLSINKDI